jgi:hypothetical protein
MRILGYIWGVAGILAVIAYAVVGLAARALSIKSYDLMWYHWAALVFGTLILIYAKSYRGFLLRLAPGIALRARSIRAKPTAARVIFAPFYCMGFFGSGVRTQVRMIFITLAMVAMIIVVRNLPEPWRAILDFGIAVALTLGFCFILMESLRPEPRN